MAKGFLLQRLLWHEVFQGRTRSRLCRSLLSSLLCYRRSHPSDTARAPLALRWHSAHAQRFALRVRLIS